MFQKDLIVWKRDFWDRAQDKFIEFQKDLIVWKPHRLEPHGQNHVFAFQKDLIVWKHCNVGALYASYPSFRRT